MTIVLLRLKPLLESLNPRSKGKEIATHSSLSDLVSFFDEEGKQDEFEALLAKRLPRGIGKYKGKLSLVCFSRKKIGHIAARCPNSNADQKEKRKRFKDKGKKQYYAAIDERRN